MHFFAIFCPASIFAPARRARIGSIIISLVSFKLEGALSATSIGYEFDNVCLDELKQSAIFLKGHY